VELLFLVAEELLLGTEHRTGAADAVPTNPGASGKAKILHGVQSNQRARSAETSLAMNRHRAGIVFADLQELANDCFGGTGSIREDKVRVGDPCLGEAGGLVLRFVQTDDVANVGFLECVDVIGRSEGGVSINVGDIMRTGECDELIGDDPVQITVFDALVKLIDISLERERVEPAELRCRFETSQAIQDVTIENGIDLRCCITEGLEAFASTERFETRERGPSLFGGFAHGEHLKATHQKSGVSAVGTVVAYLRSLGVVTVQTRRMVGGIADFATGGRAVRSELSGLDATKMHDLLIGQLRIVHLFLESQKILHDVSKMERAEIVCESLVDEFAIDGKIMDVVISDGQRLRAYPIQTIFYDLNGLRSC
jgi:hypothetical protein